MSPKSNAPLPATACPLCGGPNGCAPARAGRFDVECWCTSVTVSAEALARVPEALKGEACLCRDCALGRGAEEGAAPAAPAD